MKKQLLLLASLATGVAAFAQNSLTVAPAVPHPGQTLELTYNPAGTKLEKQTDIKGVAYLFNKKRMYYAEDVKLTQSGGVWKAKLTIPDTIALAAFKFSSDKATDNNNDKGYYIALKTADGKPVQGEQMAEGMLNQYLGGLIGLKANPKQAQALYEAEFATYPESAKGMENMYYVLLSQNKDAAKQAIQKQKILAAFKTSDAKEADLALMANAFYSSDKPLYDSLSKVVIARYPKGNMAINLASAPVYREQDPAKKVELYNNVKNNFTLPKAVNDNMLTSIATAYGAKKDYDNFKKYAALVQDKRSLPGAYNSVAWPLAEKGESLDFAAEISKQSLDIVDSYKTNPPAYYTQYPASQRETMTASTWGMYADTYALILHKQGKTAEALTYQQKAVDINKGSSPDMNERLVTFLAATGKTKQAMAKAEEFIKNGKSTETMKTELKSIYAKEKGGEKGFDTYMASLQAVADAKTRADVLEKMINLKATGFALKDFDGKEISLASLKGKVVIVDFWATWCGPCKASFPAMQKMVNKYKGNPNVEFVFVDTWETDPKKDEAVRKFIADNKYTFHVLFDTEKKDAKGKYDVVDQFGVDGIPTKFVIDKAGNIRFKSVGWSGSDDSLISELSTMIDLASNPPTVTASIKE